MKKTTIAKTVTALTILMGSSAILATSIAPSAQGAQGWDYLSHNHVKLSQLALKDYYSQTHVFQKSVMLKEGTNRWTLMNGEQTIHLKTFRKLDASQPYHVFALKEPNQSNGFESVGGIVPVGKDTTTTKTVYIHHPFLWDYSGPNVIALAIPIQTETVSLKTLDYQIRNQLIQSHKLYDKRESGVLKIRTREGNYDIPLNRKLSEAFADKYMKAESIQEMTVYLKRKDRG